MSNPNQFPPSDSIEDDPLRELREQVESDPIEKAVYDEESARLEALREQQKSADGIGE